jgi:hypothetical protein
MECGAYRFGHGGVQGDLVASLGWEDVADLPYPRDVV